MAIWNRKDAKLHTGHNLEMVCYGDVDDPASVTVECTDCSEVLVAFEDLEESGEL